jgi:dTDP-glucose pyrophosphorylase
MNTDYKDHLIPYNFSIKNALVKLNNLGLDSILFVVNENHKLIGSLTDGDIRRGLIKGYNIDNKVQLFIQINPKFITIGSIDICEIKELRDKKFKLIPVVDKQFKIVDILNFRLIKSYIPVDVVVMAGGRGLRLKPLTDKTPKPLLKVGDKAIIDHNLDRLISYGITNFYITVCYLAEQIKIHLGDGKNKRVSINYIDEEVPLGTIGSLSKINNFKNDYILLTNSDILTNINYEDFFLDCISKNADMSVVSIPYNVDIPYGVLNSDNNNKINSVVEKPTYTYYSNGGVYLIKKSILNQIPKDKFYNATDLIQTLINNNSNIISYEISDYWLDIGKHQDLNKAINDIKKINFNS